MSIPLRIAVIGNGDYVAYLKVLPNYDVIVALDGGFNHCQRLGIEPTVVLGDGDSVPANTPGFVMVGEQDTTDLQKGLHWIEANHSLPYEIDLFSVTSGDRLDHTLNAIQLARQFPTIHHIYTPTQCLQIIRDQQSLALPIHTYFSLLPLNTQAMVDLVGSKWSGKDIVLDEHHSGISNQVVAPTLDITIKQGMVLMITEQVWTKQ